MNLDTIVRRIPWDSTTGDLEELVAREWLVTNGLGGYSSGSVAGVATRRYHGVLVAALPNPFGRVVLLKTRSKGANNKRIVIAIED